MNITKEFLDKNPLLYKYVFIPHKHHGWLGNCQQAAFENEYPFFLWNDIVYATTKESTQVCQFKNAAGYLLLTLL